MVAWAGSAGVAALALVPSRLPRPRAGRSPRAVAARVRGLGELAERRVLEHGQAALRAPRRCRNTRPCPCGRARRQERQAQQERRRCAHGRGPDDPAFSCARPALRARLASGSSGGRGLRAPRRAGPTGGREGRTAGSTPSSRPLRLWALTPTWWTCPGVPGWGLSSLAALPWLCRGGPWLSEPQCPHL